VSQTVHDLYLKLLIREGCNKTGIFIFVLCLLAQLIYRAPSPPAGHHRNSLRPSVTNLVSTITSLRLHIEAQKLCQRCIPARPRSCWKTSDLDLLSRSQHNARLGTLYPCRNHLSGRYAYIKIRIYNAYITLQQKHWAYFMHIGKVHIAPVQRKKSP